MSAGDTIEVGWDSLGGSATTPLSNRVHFEVVPPASCGTNLTYAYSSSIDNDYDEVETLFGCITGYSDDPATAASVCPSTYQ